jgi:hypothetical protein
MIAERKEMFPSIVMTKQNTPIHKDKRTMLPPPNSFHDQKKSAPWTIPTMFAAIDLTSPSLIASGTVKAGPCSVAYPGNEPIDLGRNKKPQTAEYSDTYGYRQQRNDHAPFL